MRTGRLLRRLLPAVLLLCSCSRGSGPDAGTETRRLDPDPSALPYAIHLFQARGDCVRLDTGSVNGILFADVDGQAGQTLFTARNPGIVAARFFDGVLDTPVQYNLPVEFCWRQPCASLDGVLDADGDGRAELLVVAGTEDGSRWRIIQLDPVDLSERRVFELQGGEDRRPDGVWDGHYSVIGGFVARVGERDVPALALLCEAGFDLQPRGVIALDARTGAELWRVLVGPKPRIDQTLILDLDGDGRDEIVFGCLAVNNLPDGADDRPTVFALNAAGEILWRHALPVGTGSVQIRPVTDGAHVVTGVLAGSSQSPTVGNALHLLDTDGSLLAALPLDAPLQSLDALAPASDPGRFLLSLGDGALIQVRVAGGHLAVERRIVYPSIVRPIVVADLLPEPGEETVALTRQDQMLIFDQDLNLLAARDGVPFRGHPSVGSVWRASAERDFLAVCGNARAPGAFYTLAPQPQRFPWLPLGAAVLVLGFVGLMLRRIRIGGGRAPGSSRRELALQLLGRLELSNHGAIGALRSLRRLVWLAEVSEGGETVPAGVIERVQALVEDCRSHALPGLRSTLELAKLAGIDAESVSQAQSAQSDLEQVLKTQGLPASSELALPVRRLEELLQDLRFAVAEGFQSDPLQGFQRSLEAHGDTIASLGVEVKLSQEEGLACRIDAEELGFVLDNLVDNALRAMETTSTRRLELDAALDDGGVRVTVRDTGEGIIPEDWERIFQDGYTTRMSGGLGLARSRDLLRKYGGSLCVVESGPGSGTRFELLLPRAADQSASSTKRSRKYE